LAAHRVDPMIHNELVLDAVCIPEGPNGGVYDEHGHPDQVRLKVFQPPSFIRKMLRKMSSNGSSPELKRVPEALTDAAEQSDGSFVQDGSSRRVKPRPSAAAPPPNLLVATHAGGEEAVEKVVSWQEHEHEEQWQQQRLSTEMSAAMPYEIMAVDIRSVVFGQNSIANRFGNGLPLSSLVDDLAAHRVDPMIHQELVLDAVYIPEGPNGGVYVSLDNRRLKCMKMCYDEHGHPDQVRLKVFQPPHFARKMLRNTGVEHRHDVKIRRT